MSGNSDRGGKIYQQALHILRSVDEMGEERRKEVSIDTLLRISSTGSRSAKQVKIMRASKHQELELKV